MKLIRIGDTYINPEHIVSLVPKGPRGTLMWMVTGTSISIDDATPITMAAVIRDSYA